jgi:SAM-dependent methyltransferase
MTVHDVASGAELYRHRLRKIKAGRTDVAWYPYDSMSNFTHIERLLGGGRKEFFHALPSSRVLDVGACDGDVAFYLESIGLQVEAVDSPNTNHSALGAFHALHRELGSKVRLHEYDLDDRWRLEGSEYGLALCLGVLYHLKNPFYVMEELARRAHFCIVSSKIADLFRPAGGEPQSDLALAYLVDSDELNNDHTNFWVFTEECLRRMFTRSGWMVLDTLRLGSGEARAASCRDDARLFALLASRHLRAPLRRVEGWYEVAGEPWCWTAPRFRLGLPVLGTGRRTLVLVASILDATLAGGSNALNCRVNAGGEAQRADFGTTGLRTFRFQIPAIEWPCGEIMVEFWLDRPTQCPPGDERELGLVVLGMELQ